MTAGVIISIIGLAFTIIGAVWKLSAEMSKNTSAIVGLTQRIDKLDSQNEKEHEELWKEISSDEEILKDHEKRLITLENSN